MNHIKETIETNNATRQTLPSLPFQAIKNDILGSNYVLSLNFIGAKRAKALNQSTRGKEYTPNVLSFSLTPQHGEIYICPLIVKEEAKKYSLSFKKHIVYMYIHGLLHLSGQTHGEEMEKLEAKYLKKYHQ